MNPADLMIGKNSHEGYCMKVMTEMGHPELSVGMTKPTMRKILQVVIIPKGS